MHSSRAASGGHEALPTWPKSICPSGDGPPHMRQGKNKAPSIPADGNGFLRTTYWEI